MRQPVQFSIADLRAQQILNRKKYSAWVRPQISKNERVQSIDRSCVFVLLIKTHCKIALMSIVAIQLSNMPKSTSNLYDGIFVGVLTLPSFFCF